MPLHLFCVSFEDIIAAGSNYAVFQQSLLAPYYLAPKAIADNGKIGEIKQVSIRVNGFARRWDWQTLQCRLGGSVYNTGLHPIGFGLAVLDFSDDARVAYSKLDLSDRFGVKLCHENEGEIYGESPEQCLDLMEAFGGRLGCVFDMGNFVFKGYDPMVAYGLLKKYITYFHIKDALAAGAIVPAGCGEACIGQILHAYRDEFQRDVLLTIEPHLQTFDGLNKLVGVTFENPYQFPSAQAAFAEGVRATKALL